MASLLSLLTIVVTTNPTHIPKCLHLWLGHTPSVRVGCRFFLIANVQYMPVVSVSSQNTLANIDGQPCSGGVGSSANTT